MVTLLDRDLNYFRIRTENASVDHVLSYDSVVVGDQPADLCVPPSGVEVRALATLNALAGRTVTVPEK